MIGRILCRFSPICEWAAPFTGRLFLHPQCPRSARQRPTVHLTRSARLCLPLLPLRRQTIEEKFGGLKGIRMAYLGDISNNMTYDLMRGGSLMGFTVAVAGPKGGEFEIEDGVLEECDALAAVSGGGYQICATAAEAVAGADIVYTDSWQSYGVTQTEERLAALMPFQVTEEVMAMAKPGAIFMNCLPAMRGEEQTAEVIDGPQSVVFDQAENRLHAQKALLYLLITRQL